MSCAFPFPSFRVNASCFPSGDTRGSAAEASGVVIATAVPPHAGTRWSCVRLSFFSRFQRVTGTTIDCPSRNGTGAPTRGSVHRSSAVTGRVPRRAGWSVLTGALVTAMAGTSGRKVGRKAGRAA